ncbi:MAG: MotA/TolQ/ExbB proton channel family protein [Candidatus Omnitrophota bacterium]|jgi:biopolymer transport protein ExbB
MFELIVKGGPVMIPILAGSVFGLAIILERLWAFRRVGRVDGYSFVQQVYKMLKNGEIQAAVDLCSRNEKYPLASVFKVGIERRLLPADRLEKILEQAGNNQIAKLERFLGLLASVVSIEPLLGFLGTITGLISAFMSWEKAGANVTVNALAGGMYQAMITTAAGLMVAIPAALFYNYFVGRIKQISNDLTNHAIQLTEVLSEIPGAAKPEQKK